MPKNSILQFENQKNSLEILNKNSFETSFFLHKIETMQKINLRLQANLRKGIFHHDDQNSLGSIPRSECELDPSIKDSESSLLEALRKRKNDFSSRKGSYLSYNDLDLDFETKSPLVKIESDEIHEPHSKKEVLDEGFEEKSKNQLSVSFDDSGKEADFENKEVNNVTNDHDNIIVLKKNENNVKEKPIKKSIQEKSLPLNFEKKKINDSVVKTIKINPKKNDNSKLPTKKKTIIPEENEEISGSSSIDKKKKKGFFLKNIEEMNSKENLKNFSKKSKVLLNPLSLKKLKSTSSQRNSPQTKEKSSILKENSHFIKENSHQNQENSPHIHENSTKIEENPPEIQENSPLIEYEEKILIKISESSSSSSELIENIRILPETERNDPKTFASSPKNLQGATPKAFLKKQFTIKEGLLN